MTQKKAPAKSRTNTSSTRKRVNPKPARKRGSDTPAKTKGRPKGSKTEKAIVSITPGRCPRCGSTERTPYHDVRAMAYAGVEHGKPHTHIVWRRTRCRSCAQGRIDRCVENRV